MEFSREFQVLIYCARRRLEDRHQERLTGLLSSHLKWDTLLWLAGRHGLTPLLCHHLETSFLPAAPDSARRELLLSFRETGRRNLALTAELLRILELLGTHGLTALSVKGPLLGVRAYGDLALREFYDLDILVRQSDVCQARDLLLDHGYKLAIPLSRSQERMHLKTQNNFVLVRDPDVYSVELHWRLFPRLFSFPLDTDELVDRAVTFTISGRTIFTLAPPDEILYLAVHGAGHQWDRLEWLAGFTEQLRSSELNWSSVTDTAAGLGASRMLRLALHLASDVLEMRLPNHISEHVRQDATIPTLSQEVCQVIWARELPAQTTWKDRWFTARTREHWRDRLHYFVEIMATPTVADWQQIRLPEWASSLYTLVRAVRGIAKRIRA